MAAKNKSGKKITGENSLTHIVAIGASAAGYEALQDLFLHMPAELKNTCFIITQHASPANKSLLVDLVSCQTIVPAVEAADGQPLKPGKIYVAPPRKEISVQNHRIRLAKPASGAGPKTGIDILFNSLARDKKNSGNVIGIILSGAATDGLKGVIALKEAGGFVIVQKPQTAGYDGMPNAAILTDAADAVLEPDRMGAKILDYIKNTAPDSYTGKTSRQQKFADCEIYRSMFDNSLAALFITDVNGNIVEANQTAEELFGYTSGEFIDLKSDALIDGEAFNLNTFLDKRKKEGKVKGELIGIRKNGARFPCEFTSATFTDVKGKKLNSVMLIDISDRKFAEQRLKSTTNNVPGVVFRYVLHDDRTVELQHVNEGSKEIWGVDPEESMKDSSAILGLFHEDDLELVFQSVAESAKDLKPWSAEWRYNHPDGTVRWHHGMGNPVRLDDGTTVWDSIIMDVTEEKLAKEKLAENERELSLTFDTLKDAIFTIDVENENTFRFASVNRQFLLNTGLVRDEVIGAAVEDVIPKEAAELVKEKYREAIKKEETQKWEETITFKTGSKTGVVSVTPVFADNGNCKQLIGSVSDITERKAAEDALRKVMDQSLDVICTIDETGSFLSVSEASKHVWGYTPEEMQGLSFLELIHPEDQEHAVQLTRQIINGEPVTNFENRCIKKDGAPVDMIWSARWDAEDKLLYCVAKDATELKEAERKVKISEQRFRNMVQEGVDMIAILSVEGIYQYVSPSYKIILGYEPEELLGKNAFERVHPDDLAYLKEQLDDVGPAKKITPVPYRVKRKDGTYIRLQSTGTNVIDDPYIKGIIVNSTDITESYYYNRLDQLERKILEQNISGENLVSILENYILGIELLHEGMKCSILKKDGNQLFNLASPSLQASYINAIDGIEPGQYAGACGTAAYTGEKVVISDAENDKRTEKYLDLVEKYNFKALWSNPVKNSDGEVIATFAAYYNEPRKPDELEENTIERAGQLVRLILENRRIIEELNESNERYDYVTQATSDAIWDYVPVTNKLFWGEGFKTLFGYERNEDDTGIDKWINNIHPKDAERVRGLVVGLLSGGQEKWDEEYRFKKSDGTYAFVRDKAIVVRDESGETERIIGAMEDITQKKREEQRLKLMESVVTNTSDAVVITKAEPLDAPDGPEIVYVNEAFEKMTGYKSEEVIGKTPRILQGPNTDRQVLKEFGEKIRRWEPAEVETINYKKNGDEFWINFSVTPLANEKGWYTHWISIERDTTERKNREIKQQLINKISVIFNETDRLREALTVTLRTLKDFGSFQLAEVWLAGHDKKNINLVASLDYAVKQFYVADDSVATLARGKGLPGKVWKTGKPQFWKNLDKRKTFIRKGATQKAGLKTGYGFPIQCNNEVTGVLMAGVSEALTKPQYFAPILEEVAKHLGEEIERKRLEEELSRIFMSVPDIICVAGFDGYFKNVNPAMSDLLGYTEEELLNTPIIEFIHPEDASKTKKALEAIKEGEDTHSFENRYVTKNGKIVWLAWTSKVFHEEKETYGVAKDVTVQKELEELLDQANRLAKIGSWEYDMIEGELYWSTITKEILEVDDDFVPAIEQMAQFYKEGENSEQVTKAVNDAIKKGAIWDIEIQAITGKGNERWIRTIGKPDIVDGTCVRLYGSFQDIHKRKEAEEHLKVKTSHIEAISRLNSALLNYREWYKALSENLEVIGEAVKADRVYYFENRYDAETGEGFSTQRLEWCREGIEPQIDSEDLVDMAFSDVPELFEPMLKNKPSSAVRSEVSEGTVTKYILEDQDINTFLALPVMINGRFHGFVGFDNCTTEEYWSDDEITMLETITSNLAIAIERDNADKALQELFKEKNSILESISDAFYAVDSEWNITYFNKEAENLLEKKSDSVLWKNFWEVFPPAAETELYQTYTNVMESGQAASLEYYYPPLDSWYDISAYPSEAGISVYFKNIDERKETQERILKKTRQLDSIAKFNGLLIQEENWLDALEKSLEDFAEVAEADRVYFFENDMPDGAAERTTTIKVEWVREGFSAQLNNPGHYQVPFSEISVIMDGLSQNKPLNEIVSDIKDKEFREFLNEQNIQSVLAIPVFTGDEFRGFIGFDDCTKERRWGDDEFSFLHTIAINLASAIENDDSDVALQHAFEEKNKILESIGDGFFALDNNFTVTYWNNQAEQLLFTPKDKVLNQNLWDLFDKELARESFLYYEKAIKEQIPVKFEDYYGPLGKWFDVNVYPAADGISVFFKDITEEKKAEEQLLYKSKLIEAIASVNSTLLAYEDWFEAIEKTFGIIGEAVNVDRVYYFENSKDQATGEEVTNQKLEWTRDNVTSEKNNPKLQNVPVRSYPEISDHLRQNKPYANIANNIADKDIRAIMTEQGVLSLLVIPIFVQNSFWGFIGFDDCSKERIWTDEEISFLKTITINLANAIEVREADIAFKKLYKELEKNVNQLAASNAELEQFAFVASHDLQEPLRMITGFLAQLERKYNDMLDEKGKKYIYFATDGAKRMRQIILDLLEFSRVGRIDTEREEIDVAQLIDDVLSLNKKLIADTGADVIIGHMPVIYAAKGPIRQLFQNIVNNALKYQKAENKPIVEICSKEKKTEWLFTIKDNGIGIPKPYFDKIFNIFQRLHGKQEYSGTGMGLAICKKIVEDHGGTIHVESEEGEGSTFYFTIRKERPGLP